MKIISSIFVLLLVGISFQIFAQNNRNFDNNQIGWYAFFVNHQLDEKWSIHGEFQWRRTEVITNGQQNLYRTGVNYKIHPQITLRAGYAFADTYNYGQVPISSNGIRFPEHRSYQMILFSAPIEKFIFSHRFMVEQRWVGRSWDPKATQADAYVYLNRLRYMFRVDMPLKGDEISENIPYLSLYDEIMIGFGENVNQNVFDQNRLGFLVGTKLSPKIRTEGGYFQQILQLGRLVEGKNQFQKNSGFIINTFFNF